MPPVHLLLTGMCLALLGLWLGLLARRDSLAPGRSLLLGGLAFGVLCSLVIPLALYTQAPKFVLLMLVAGHSGIAFFYWLLSRSLVDDTFRPGPRDWSVLVVKILVTVVSVNPQRPFLLPDLSSPEQEVMRFLPPALFSAVLILLGLWHVYRDLRHDLVESRRRMRLQYLAVSGVVILVIIVARLALHGDRLDRLYEGVRLTLTLGVFYWLSFVALRLRPEFLQAAATSGNNPAVDVDPDLKERLRALFEEERMYRTEGLTIRMTAARLDVPEYRLRRLINGGLGYRNFNDFLNRYRMEEARQLLVDRRDLPVLRVAMDLGFRSLSSFNKAFKESTGLTPTSFREKS